jgi:hypothetical protein
MVSRTPFVLPETFISQADGMPNAVGPVVAAPPARFLSELPPAMQQLARDATHPFMLDLTLGLSNVVQGLSIPTGGSLCAGPAPQQAPPQAPLKPSHSLTEATPEEPLTIGSSDQGRSSSLRSASPAPSLTMATALQGREREQQKRNRSAQARFRQRQKEVMAVTQSESAQLQKQLAALQAENSSLRSMNGVLEKSLSYRDEHIDGLQMAVQQLDVSGKRLPAAGHGVDAGTSSKHQRRGELGLLTVGLASCPAGVMHMAPSCASTRLQLVAVKCSSRHAGMSIACFRLSWICSSYELQVHCIAAAAQLTCVHCPACCR